MVPPSLRTLLYVEQTLFEIEEDDRKVFELVDQDEIRTLALNTVSCFAMQQGIASVGKSVYL